MPYNVVPAEQPHFPHAVRIGEWLYPTNEQGQALAICPLCEIELPPLGATPGHVCGKPFMTEQEFLELSHDDSEVARKAAILARPAKPPKQ